MKRMFGLIGLCVVLCAVNGCNEKKKPAGPPPVMMMPPPAVIVAPVVKQFTGVSKPVMGYIEAIDTVEVQPRIQGYLEKLNFTEGSMVYKDSILAEIEETSYIAKAKAAEAVLQQAKAEETYAKINFKRQKQVVEKGAGTQMALDEAQRAVDLSRAKVSECEATLLDAENNLSYTKIYAPISGRIGRADNSVGNYVTATTRPLATIVQMDPIFIRLSISESDYQSYVAHADSGTTFLPQLDVRVNMANGEPYQAPWRLAIVDNRIDPSTGTITMWLEFSNMRNLLIPGGYVTVALSETLKEAYPAVKSSAVLNDNKTSYVYVLGAGNIPERRDIKEVERVNDLVLISEGVTTADTVIVDGMHKIRPQSPVSPQFAK